MLKKLKKMDSQGPQASKSKKEENKQGAIILDSDAHPSANQTDVDLMTNKQVSLEINIPAGPSRPKSTRQITVDGDKSGQSIEQKTPSPSPPRIDEGLKLQYDKVMQTIYWYDGTDQQKIEIKLEFLGQKRVLMKPIEQSAKTSYPEGATHYIKKLLDSKVYEFVFFVDDKETTSPHYDLNESKSANRIDLSEAEVKIFIKKPRKQLNSNQMQKSSQGSHSQQNQNNSQYDTFSKFLENEEDTLQQLEDDPSLDEDFEELNKQEDMSLNQLIQNVEIDNVEIVQSLQIPTQGQKASFAFKPTRVIDGDEQISSKKSPFDLQIDIDKAKVVSNLDQNDSERNMKQLSYRKMLAGNNQVMGRKSLIRKQASSAAIMETDNHNENDSNDLKNLKAKESETTPLGQSQIVGSQFQNNQQLELDSDSSGQEEINIEEAANSLFNSWFVKVFEANSTQLDSNGNVFITKAQFEAAVRSIEVIEEEDQIEHLLSLYSFAEQNDEGQITQEQLMESIKKDLKIQLGQEESKQRTKDPFKSPEPRTQGLSVTTNIQKSYSNGDRPSTVKHNRSNTMALQIEDGSSEDLQVGNSHDKKRKNELKVNNFTYKDDETDKERVKPIEVQSQLIRVDPIINQLHKFNSKELQGIVRCDNLIEVLEYIASNKLEEYRNDETALEEVFKLLIQNSKLLSTEFENLQAKVETLDDMGNEEIQQYQEQNSELEGQLCLMEAELEKMKMYEQSYHTQEKRLQAALDNAEDLFEEKNNIEQVHMDLVAEFNESRKENEKMQIENRTLQLEVQGLKAQTEQLKKQVVDGYGDGSDSDTEMTKLADDQVGDAEEEKSSVDAQTENEDNSPGKGSHKSNDPQFLSPKDEKKRLQQDIPTDLDPLLPLETQKKVQPTAEQKALERMLEEEENAILSDLENNDVYRLQGRIKNYIENNVRPNRSAMKAQLTKQYNSQIKREQALRKKLTSAQIKNGELYSELELTRLKSVSYQNSREAKQREIDSLQEQLQTVIQQNQQLRDEKVRIASVNSILEQKIQVERSGHLSLQNDVENMVRRGGIESMQSSNSKIMRNMGQMSSYLRKQQNAIRSMRGSAYSGASGFSGVQSLQRRKFKGKFGGQKMSAYGGDSHRDRESQNQRMYIKYQTKKNAGNQSAYRDNENSSTAGFDIEMSNRDVVIDDDQSDASFDVVRMSNTPKAQKFQNRRFDNSSNYRGSAKGSVKSGRRRGDQDRVQVINDLESEDESIGEYSQNELGEINQDIEKQERTALLKKREENQYDLLGLKNESHEFYKQIHEIRDKFHEEKMKKSGLVKREHKGMVLKLVEFKDAADNALYTEAIKIYFNRNITEALLVMFEGQLYLFQLDETKSKLKLLFKPFNFLDDVQKVIYSEKYDNYLALKLTDLRKTEGNRDHLIIEVQDRELFADFVMEYAEKEEDEVIFEQNEEFSMIAESSPVWFSFEDVERCNKTRESKNQFKNQDLTGFLEHRSNIGINISAIFKLMVSQNANWVQKYFALKGAKLFIYKDQKFDKPSQVLELTDELIVKQIRKGDCQGKQFVFTLQPSKEAPTEWLAASSEINLTKWLDALKALKNQFQIARQQERDKLKLAMKKPEVDKTNRICSGVFEKKVQKSPVKIVEDDSESANGEEEFDFSEMMDQELPVAKQKISFYNEAITEVPEVQDVDEAEAMPDTQNQLRKFQQAKHSIILEDEENVSAQSSEKEKKPKKSEEKPKKSEQKKQKSPKSSDSDYSFKSM